MTSGMNLLKRPFPDFDAYEDNPSPKMQRHIPMTQNTTYPPFTINPFREMVVELYPHLVRQDIIKMAYIMELSDTFEEEMGPSRDPFFYLFQVAERVGRVTKGDVNALIDALMVLKKPHDAVKLVTDYKEKYLQPSQDATVWKKTTLQPEPEQKPAEKDFTKYWLKFRDWCNRQNILDASEASCKTVIEYLNSLTSSNKFNTIMNYYKGILQHHKDFKFNDKVKLEACIKELREQEKKNKN